MPYDPNLPAFGSPDSSAEMRSQLQGLFAAIQSVPTGPQGPQGNPGPPFADAVVDGVTTLNPGEAATVGVSFDGTDVHFAFGIPRGDVGSQGPQGDTGPAGAVFTNFVVQSTATLAVGEPATVSASFDGTAVQLSFGIPQGPEGPTGPAFTNFTVAGVTTLAAGQPATVDVAFDGTAVGFTFGIPQGPPGPLDQGTLDNAISTTARNPNVIDLALTVSNPPTQAEMQQVVDKLNELMAALRRPI